jgi:superfamily II DNA or RNA helicase
MNDSVHENDKPGMPPSPNDYELQTEVIEANAPDVISHLGSLTIGAESALREHQVSAFDKIVNFYREGGREGYVLHPTGTGKTVLFVELSKELIESSRAAGNPSRVIILVPKVDLVNQTVGSVDPETGKKRGFKGFAPEIDVRDVHGQVSDRERADNIQNGEVLVTTYDSFRGLVRRFVRAESKDLVDWMAEKAEHEIAADYAETQRRNLENQRRQFTVEFFVKKEIRNATKFVKTYKPEEDELKPDNVNDEVLKRLELIVDSNLDDTQKLKALRRYLKKIIPKTQWSKSLTKKSTTVHDPILNATVEKVDPFGSFQSSDSEKPVQYETTVSNFEWFAVRYIRRHDRPVPIAAQVFNNDRAKRQEFYSLSDQISGLRDQERMHSGKAQGAEINSKIQQAIDQFDLIIADEAHRSIGTKTWEAIREYAANKAIAILGLTATDSYLTRSLEDYYEKKIDEITLDEAIYSGLNNPMAIFVHETGMRFSGIELDNYGDYDYTTLRELRFSEERNMIGVNYAKELTEAGYSGLISAIPGDGGAHAQEITKLCNSQIIKDPKTGEDRSMRAAYVFGTGMKPEDRQAVYDDFEKGLIDWVVFVDVIREGWDSDTAKALINMRPTRSPLLARQRQGRVGRLSPDGQVSVVIDIFDGYDAGLEGTDMPPVTAVDVFELPMAYQGQIIGNVDPQGVPIIQKLKQQLDGPIKAHFTDYATELGQAHQLSSTGRAIEIDGRAQSDWRTLRSLKAGFKDYLSNDFIEAMTAGDSAPVRTSVGRRKNDTLTKLYNLKDINQQIAVLPEVNPIKLFVDDSDDRWISPGGFQILLAKIAPRVSAEEVEISIHEMETAGEFQFARKFGKVRLSYTTADGEGRYGITNLYRLDEIRRHVIPKLVKLN